MEKEFVPYILAVKLKELGFDEKCIAVHHTVQKLSSFTQYGVKNSEIHHSLFTAPLWQQAFDWFESKHWLFVITEVVNLADYRNSIVKHPGREFTHIDGTYENKTESNIACLEKLIEIVSNP